MRWFSLATVVIAAALSVSLGSRGFAQDQSGAASNSQATGDPQSQVQDNQGKGAGKAASRPVKKSATKAKDAGGTSSANSSSSHASADSSQAPPAKDENPFPEAVSRAAVQSTPDGPASSGAKGSPASTENPFPEDVSRDAAKRDAGSSAQAEDGQKPKTQAPKAQTRDPLPPGVSSSRSADDPDNDVDSGDSLPGPAGSKVDEPLGGQDAALAKHDAQVGGFYLQTGDNRGAYLRYQDALRHDPTNVDAIFGLAEAAKALKLVAEAQRNYQLYLAIVPQGAKAKEATKALRSLDTQK